MERKPNNQIMKTEPNGKGQESLASATCSAADEYLKTHKSAKWCPVCGMIYLLRFAPVLTITGLIIAAIIGGCMGHYAASRRTTQAHTQPGAAVVERKQKEQMKNEISNVEGAPAVAGAARGSAWRIRQLIDGRYVAEERRGWIFKTWVAVDLKSPRFLWDANDEFYRDCIGDADSCLKALAGRGHSMPNRRLEPQPRIMAAGSEKEKI